MIILVCLIGLFILIAFVWITADRWSDLRLLSELGLIISGALLLIVLIGLPMSHMGYQSEIRQFRALETTLQEMRKKESIENTAIQMKVAECNQWLAKSKYWNESIFDLWVPDEIEEIKPIK